MQNRQKIHTKIRHRLSGTTTRPRLAIYRSLNNIFAQLIDDSAGVTVVSASSLKLKGGLTKKAQTVGKEIATKAKAAKISEVVFDRGGFPYAGSIKQVAEAAREEGLKI